MRRDRKRMSTILMILCHFALVIGGMQGGIISLNSYVIPVGEKHKTLILIGLVHEGDLEADTCKVGYGLFTPAKNLSYDHPAHAKIMEKVLFDRLLTDDESLSSKGDRGKSIIPVILEKGELEKQHPDASLFEDQLIINRKSNSNSLATRVPLLCLEPRSTNDILFMKWLNGSLLDVVNIVPDPQEMKMSGKKYEKYAEHFDLKVHHLPGGGVALRNFAPYLHVKDNIDRYKGVVSDFESHVKQFGRGDLLFPALSDEKTFLNAFPKSTIQTNILAVNNGFLKFLKGWLKTGSLSELCAMYQVEEPAMKYSLNNAMAIHLANMSFFSACAKQLLQPNVQTVVACVGAGHVVAIDKIIQELGGEPPNHLGSTDSERESYTFLTPFHLRMFLSISLGLPVDKGDVTIFEEMNSGKLADAPRCNWCRKKSQVLKRCTGSCGGKVLYCGPECQKADWPYHKKKCQSVQRSKKEDEKKGAQ